MKNDYKKEERKKELFKAIDNDNKYISLICELLFLEEKLDELKPYIKLVEHPTNRNMKKMSITWKQYKELEQQYQNAIKNYHRILTDKEKAKEKKRQEKENINPFELWMKTRINEKYETR